jgi:hypothetical protein
MSSKQVKLSAIISALSALCSVDGSLYDSEEMHFLYALSLAY